MNRRITGVVSGVAVLGLAVMAVPGIAQAAPDLDAMPPAKSDPQMKPDNKPDPLADKRSAIRQNAIAQLVAGKATTVGKGANRTIKMSDGTKVDYPATQSSQLLTFLVEFGDGTGNPAFPDNTAGPLHNEIPAPGADDNSTYWKSDFSRQHYLDMFFNGMPEQDGESFKNVYSEMSSGRFDLQGDVSDWVQVDHPESYYQSATGDEDATSMRNYIQDTANAWYDDQLAAGQTDAQIKDYLQSFDIWDRYDYDGDGDFNEPDGYVDHFQAIHAGDGEEAGAEPWAIWSHRWAANPGGKVGPEGNQAGGVQIGDTGIWIRDYTTEPENGGLGVFAHEFGHDLGLPDYYDTAGGDNGTGFWNLMSSGSWMGHGDGAIGTTPDHMGATEKLFLGWYGPDDLAIVNGKSAPKKVVLGPSYHATNVGAQALAVNLPKKNQTIHVVDPDDGGYLYSGTGDNRTATATSPSLTVPADDQTLTARVSYNLEDDYDYTYVDVSEDGSTWTRVPTSVSDSAPAANNGIDGCSGGGLADDDCDNAWVDMSVDLSAYAGKTIQVRFQTVNDGGVHFTGFTVDSIAFGDQSFTFDADADGWTLNGYRFMDTGEYTTSYSQYYLAENRQYQGYDETLAEGPYSFDYSVTAPDKVDQFPYQDGLLVWFANGAYEDNNTSSHPGGGQALPVDANPEYQLWTTPAGAPRAYANGRLNTRDATFDVDSTDGLHLTNESNGGMKFDVDEAPGVPVFDDSDPDAYWDDSYHPRSGWYSTQVAGAGTMIQVLSSDETTGQMTVKVGQAFVATTEGASIEGTPAVGETLTAVDPAYFQDDVDTTYQWMVDGKSVWNATGPTYEVQAKDAGKEVSVEITGSKSGYLSSTDSASVTIEKAPAPVPSSDPTVDGKAQVGKTLHVTGAEWPVEGTSTFTWMVGDKAVGEGTSHQVRPAEVGKKLTVVETFSSDGAQDATATSEPTGKVAPATTSMSAKAKPVKRGKKPQLTVSVKASGITPTGSVQVRFAGKTMTKKVHDGKVTFSLPAQSRPGVKKAKVTFRPDQGFTGTAKTVKIRVKR